MLGMKWSDRWLASAVMGMLLAFLPLAPAGAGGSVPKPVIQKAQGEQCVEDTDYMRRNHMKVLNHHRDKTVHQGIRTKQHSLKGCIDCHATPNAAGQKTVLGKDHFCQSCHTYAAVQVDCFQCHSSRPAPAQTSVLVSRKAAPAADGSNKPGITSRSASPAMATFPSTQQLTGGIK